MYLHKTPRIIQDWFPKYTWRRETDAKELYLTFDDGPIPELTPWILEQLNEYDAKATFFVVGDNVEKHPSIFERTLDEGHKVGNHTFNHLNGRKNDFDIYLSNVEQCQKLLPEGTPYFRPPYGRMTFKQSRALLQEFEIIMWDVLSADFDTNITPEICLDKSITYTSPGSIIVFHDNVKATERLKFTLPRYLAHFKDLGYSFKTL